MDAPQKSQGQLFLMWFSSEGDLFREASPHIMYVQFSPQHPICFIVLRGPETNDKTSVFFFYPTLVKILVETGKR